MSGPEGIWGRRQRKAANQYGVSDSPLSFTSGIVAIPRKHCGHCPFSGHCDKSPFKLPLPHHTNLNLDPISGRCRYEPGSTKCHTGGSSRSGCQAEVKGSCRKDLKRRLHNHDHASEGQRKQRRGWGRQEAPLTQSTVWAKRINAITQPRTSANSAQKAKGADSKSFPSRKELKWDSGKWAIHKHSH